MIKKQFYKRLRHELGRKWKSIRSITDWTVALYIVIPAFIFMGIYYRSTMDGRIIDGRDCLFRIKSTRILCDYIWKRVRSFFEQADSLFLISYPAHMQKLIQYGMTYTFIRIAITNTW